MINLKKKPVRFIKIVIIFILASALLVYPTISSAQKDFSALVKKVVPSVAVINVYDIDGKLKNLGTGFFITPDGGLVTNYHVIEGGMRAEAKLSSGEVLPIEGIISEDREGDLVLLTIGLKGRSFPTLKLTETKIESGQPVIVIGSPFGLEGTVSDGIISGIRNVPDFWEIIQITAPISKGSSGSPVLNMRGEVIGVATFFIKEGQSLNFAISGDKVKSLLSRRETKPVKIIELLKRDFQSYSELFILSYYSYIEGRYEDAIRYTKERIQKRLNDEYAYCLLGEIYEKLGRHYEAIEAYKQAIQIKPNEFYPHVFLGNTYNKLGHHYEAIEVYKQAIKIEPHNALLYSLIAYAYKRVGRYNDALRAYTTAIQIKPDDESFHLGLGWIYSLLDRYYEAIESYKRAIQIDPNYIDAHYWLGFEYIRAGNRKMALEQYKILKELDTEKANELFNLIYK
jgi:tetratricopeptide (TPR) repeat protein